jgi:hypothetical protein
MLTAFQGNTMATKKSKKLVRKLKESHTLNEALELGPIPDIMAGLTDMESETIEKILSEVMDLEKNIGAKSRIPVPINTARLDMVADIYKEGGYPIAYRILSGFSKNIRHNQISEDGERVKEVIRALSESLKEARTMGERLSAPPPE